MPKVSVIVPTYNYAHFLPRCLDSLVNQTLHDIEIIIVDDCSTDNTAEVVKPYLTDSRVKYIKNEVNQKLYASRIVGMKAASGSYIAHCDADDLYELQAMQLMCGHAEKTGADIVTGNAVNNSNNNYIAPEKAFTSNREHVFKDFLNKRLSHHVVWRTLYKKGLIQKYLAETPDVHINVCEDALANFILYFRSQKWEHLNEAVYHYCKNPQSITYTKGLLEKASRQLEDYIVFYQEIQFYFQNNKEIINLKKEVNTWLDEIIYYAFCSFAAACPENYIEEWLKIAPPAFQASLLRHLAANQGRLQGIKGEFIRLMKAIKIGLKKFFA